jgi:hypothetical protein
VNRNADGFQVAVGAVDMCGIWCGSVGTGACHSHAPLIDEIKVQRVGVTTPQFRAFGNFLDAFAADGTLTGTAGADAPGDSVSITITPLGTAGAGSGPNAYIYVNARRKAGNPALSGAVLGSNTVRAAPMPTAYGTRWPFVGTASVNSVTWSIFRMDTTFTAIGTKITDAYCVDLNDNLFVPGDTVFYFYAADADNAPNNGNESYLTRTINGQGAQVAYSTIGPAAASPMEFTILPGAGGILYVSIAGGDRSFNSAFEMLGLRVDRYDRGVLLSSGVKNVQVQLLDTYRTVLWDYSIFDLPSEDAEWGLLFDFLDKGTLGAGPGLYIGAENQAERWGNGPGAIALRSAYMNFNLLDVDHINHGESVSPHLTASGASFIHSGVPDEMVVYGGCPGIKNFDVLEPTGGSIMEYPYPASGDGAVISMQRLNSNGKTATVVLSGFSYGAIREAGLDPTPARVEFLRDLLIKMGNVVPLPTGIDPKDTPSYANALYDNYPNPFNPTTTIKYNIKVRGHVSLKIYNVAGQLVRTLVDEVQTPEAIQPVAWDGTNDAGQAVGTGVYFYKLSTKNFSQSRKAVFLK